MLKIILILLIFSTKVFAIEDTQQWLNLTFQGSFSENTPVGYYFETQARRSEDQDQFFEKFFRPALYYRSEGVGTFFLGLMKRFDSTDQEIETRHWVQYLLPFQNSIFRIRMEQRHINGFSRNSDRIRIFGRINGQQFQLDTLRPFVSLELFHNLNDVGQNIQSGSAQIRTMLGFSLKLNEQLNFEISYLNQRLMLTSRPDETNHVMNFVLNVTHK